MNQYPSLNMAFLSADDPLFAYIDERYLTRYKTPVSGLPGLRQRVATEARGPNASSGF